MSEGPAFPLSVLTNQGTAFKVSITRQGIPLVFYVDRLPPDLSKALWDVSPSHFLQQSYQVSWPLIPRCTEQPQAPASLSHVFHWETKWYSMLPIAPLSLSFFFSPRASSLSVCCWQIRKALRNCTVISARETDKRRFSLGAACDLTDSRLHLGHLVGQKLNLHHQRAKPHGIEFNNADVLKIISHLMRKYDSRGMLK